MENITVCIPTYKTNIENLKKFLGKLFKYCFKNEKLY